MCFIKIAHAAAILTQRAMESVTRLTRMNLDAMCTKQRHVRIQFDSMVACSQNPKHVHQVEKL